MTFATIFDVDGVLVDSYQAHFDSYRLLGQELGLTMSPEQFDTHFGRTTRETIAAVWPQRGFCEEEIRALDDRKELLFRSLLSDHFPVMEGASELLEQLHVAGWQLAVGSSGPPENVALVMDQVDRQNRIRVRVTGRDVTRGKPDPQVFLMAAERLGVPPECCLVVEDAAAGVTAASAANMATVGLVSTGRTRDELSAADLVVGSLCELSVDTLKKMVLTPS